MHRLLLLLILAVLAGCGTEPQREGPPAPLRLEELAVPVDSLARSFFLSDRSGGFLTGSVERGAATLHLSWGVEGVELLQGLTLEGERSREPRTVTGGEILPSHARWTLGGDAELEIEPVETGIEGVHALLLRVAVGGESLILQTRAHASLGAPSPLPGGGGLSWRGTLVLYAGEGLTLSHSLPVLAAGARHTILFCYSAHAGHAQASVGDLYARGQELHEARHARLTALLNGGLFRTSDSVLTRAVNWFKLSLDALVVAGRDTMIAPGAPWDGAFDVRAASQSMTGLELAAATREIAPALLRTAAHWQDTNTTSATYGRLPLRMIRGRAEYGAADVSAWFLREQYEHIARSADTILVHRLYPLARRSIEGIRARSLDRRGLLRHGAGETWQKNASRADRAIEVETLWYYEQMIGSFLAAFLGHSETSNRWAAAAETTQVAITELFMDTTSMQMVDHLRPDGSASTELTPNGLLAFELTPSELFRQKTIESLVGALVSSHGVSVRVGGAIWPWLAGQISYVLTRYDHQALSYRIHQWMMHAALERDMVGVLPEYYLPKTPAGQVRASGLPAYGPSMGEFVRAMYQDYLGFSIDALSRQLTLNPKLPPSLTETDVTILVGSSQVRVRYEIEPTSSRAILVRSGGHRELKVGFIWTLPDGNAWRGSAMIGEEGELRLVFSADDVLAYRDGQEVEIAGKWKLQNFSRRGELIGLRLADASSP